VIEAKAMVRVGETEFGELQAALAPIGERTLRNLLRDTGLPLAPLVEGVRQDTFANLERTLIAFAGEYNAASGDRARQSACRKAVIASKDHARLAGRSARDEYRKRQKEEMVRWMLVWLENPGAFSQWVRLWRLAHPDPD
jgi:hypothetical protein